MIPWLRMVGVFIVWVVVVAVVEVTSTELLQRRGSTILLFSKHGVGTMAALVAGTLMQSKIPPFYWTRQLWLSWRSLESKLFLGVAIGNIAALFCMYTGYRIGGMAGAYAFKSTEPLLTCVLSTALVQRIFATYIPSETLSNKEPPGIKEWMSVGLVCLGSTMCSLALHGTTSASATSAWVVASNLAFGIRTVFQKALFNESAMVSGGQTDVVLRLFVDMGVVGTLFFGLVFAIELSMEGPAASSVSDLTADDVRLMLTSGVGYFLVQALNCVVLLHFSSVAYSVAKQVRVIVLFAFSAVYFAVTFQSPALAAVGAVLVLGGTFLFSLHAKDVPKQTSRNVDTAI